MVASEGFTGNDSSQNVIHISSAKEVAAKNANRETVNNDRELLQAANPNRVEDLVAHLHEETIPTEQGLLVGSTASQLRFLVSLMNQKEGSNPLVDKQRDHTLSVTDLEPHEGTVNHPIRISPSAASTHSFKDAVLGKNNMLVKLS